MSARAIRAALAAALALTCACRPASEIMADQPRVDGLDASASFPDGGAARQLPRDSVPRVAVLDTHAPRLDELLPDDAGPGPVDAATLRRGRERFGIWCSPCHGWTGDGRGAVVERGYPAPPDFVEQRLRDADDAHLLQVIDHGLGKMPPYGPHVPPSDRRAIVAWIRVLQRSRHARLADAPPAERARLTASREEGDR